VSHRLKVIRIYAVAVDAAPRCHMVDLKPDGDRADEKLIGDAVDHQHPPARSTGSNPPVPVALDLPRPEPAPVGLLDLAPEPFL
jgi:hypothetical protein